MTELTLIGQSTVFPAWFTTLWLISIGVTVGLVLVAAVLGIFYLLSRIPGLGDLEQRPQAKFAVSSGLGVVIALIFLSLTGMAFFGNSAPEGSLFGKIGNFFTLILVIIPGAFALAFSVVSLISSKTISEIPNVLREGLLKWISILSGGLVAFALIGFLLSMVNGLGVFLIVKDPGEILKSVVRLPYTGEKTTTYQIPAAEGEDVDIDKIPSHPITVSFRGNELRGMQFETNQRIEISPIPYEQQIETDLVVSVPETAPDEPLIWRRALNRQNPFPPQEITTLHVRNLGESTANLKLTITSKVDYPEVKVIPYTAICVVAFYLIYLLQRSFLPKVSAIALSTFKTETTQPLFLMLVLVGGFFLLLSIYIPYYTLGEDIKMFKDLGLTVVLVFSIFLAVWAASKSVAEEIEGRTALTVLSKPIRRRDFILGKLLGISWSIALFYVVLGLWFLVLVSYKPIYEARELAMPEPSWMVCYSETMQVIPGLVLAFMEAVLFVFISVAISTRLPMLANFLICFSIYVLGHLTPLMVQSTTAIEAFEFVVFFGQLIATIFPVLDHFNVQAAITGGTDVPLEYLGWSFVYCMIYGTITLLLSLVLFEDRDLA